MLPLTIEHPSSSVPYVALAFGQQGQSAALVKADSGLPVREQAYTAARTMAADVVVTAGRAVLLDCTAGGTITLVLAGGGTMLLHLAEGVAILPFAAASWTSSGTTAQFSAWALD